MKVYVVRAHIDFAGFEILGIFSTREKAIEAEAKYWNWVDKYFNDIDIQEVPLDDTEYGETIYK